MLIAPYINCSINSLRNIILCILIKEVIVRLYSSEKSKKCYGYSAFLSNNMWVEISSY